MLEMLKKYQLILSFLKVSTLDVTKLQSVLKMFNVSVDPNVLDIIMSMLKEVAETKKIDSVGKLLMDPEIQQQMAVLIADSSTQSNDGEKVQPNSSDMVHADSLIPCTHCQKRVHIRSAVALMQG